MFGLLVQGMEANAPSSGLCQENGSLSRGGLTCSGQASSD